MKNSDVSSHLQKDRYRDPRGQYVNTSTLSMYIPSKEERGRDDEYPRFAAPGPLPTVESEKRLVAIERRRSSTEIHMTAEQKAALKASQREEKRRRASLQILEALDIPLDSHGKDISDHLVQDMARALNRRKGDDEEEEDEEVPEQTLKARIRALARMARRDEAAIAKNSRSVRRHYVTVEAPLMTYKGHIRGFHIDPSPSASPSTSHSTSRQSFRDHSTHSATGLLPPGEPQLAQPSSTFGSQQLTQSNQEDPDVKAKKGFGGRAASAATMAKLVQEARNGWYNPRTQGTRYLEEKSVLATAGATTASRSPRTVRVSKQNYADYGKGMDLRKPDALYHLVQKQSKAEIAERQFQLLATRGLPTYHATVAPDGPYSPRSEFGAQDFDEDGLVRHVKSRNGAPVSLSGISIAPPDSRLGFGATLDTLSSLSLQQSTKLAGEKSSRANPYQPPAPSSEAVASFLASQMPGSALATPDGAHLMNPRGKNATGRLRTGVIPDDLLPSRARTRQRSPTRSRMGTGQLGGSASSSPRAAEDDGASVGGLDATFSFLHEGALSPRSAGIPSSPIATSKGPGQQLASAMFTQGGKYQGMQVGPAPKLSPRERTQVIRDFNSLEDSGLGSLPLPLRSITTSHMERRDVPQRPPTTFAGSSAALAHLRRELRDQPAEALRASKWHSYAARKIDVLPSEANYGTLRQGISYVFPISIKNLSLSGKRYRVAAAAIDEGSPPTTMRIRYPSLALAPGMSTNLLVLICGHRPGKVSGYVLLHSEDGSVTIPVTAQVLDSQAFAVEVNRNKRPGADLKPGSETDGTSTPGLTSLFEGFIVPNGGTHRYVLPVPS